MSLELQIIIGTHNSVHVVGELLDSIPAALGELNYEVVVVDNGSNDGTADFVAARGGCRVVRSGNVGYAGGINQGVQAASSQDAILILNPDIRLHPGSVPPLLEALRKPGVGIVAPQVRSPQGRLELSLRREPSLLRALGLGRTKFAALSEYVADQSKYEVPGIVDWALGAALLVSRRCYELLGGWDESYFLYSEETDFCLRARDIGLETRYEPRSVAIHIGGASGRTGTTHAMRIVNRVRLYRRRHSLMASWCYYWLTVASELSWMARGNRESRSSIMAVLRPTHRPRELKCSDTIMPR
jgi:N-acetylglucosaminyl-diphospho-decaprenol L-rhamnosyltransferase